MQEQQLEGSFRYVHSRLVTHSEEVAFYGGEVRWQCLHSDRSVADPPPSPP